MTSNQIYRGATVEDLQLSPALVLPSNTTAGVALQMAYERDFSILPISDPATRRLEGWVSIAQLKKEAGETGIEESQLKDLGSKGGAVTRFVRSRKYKVITPATSLEELDTFLTGANVSFALVTDSDRKFVLGLVTKEDLEKFISRRMPNARSA